MRRITVVVIVVAVGIVFFFLPVVPESWANFGGGPETHGWVSLSFAFFQCGAYVGGVGIQVPNGAFANGPAPFWLRTSNWNCQFPQLLV